MQRKYVSARNESGMGLRNTVLGLSLGVAIVVACFATDHISYLDSGWSVGFIVNVNSDSWQISWDRHNHRIECFERSVYLDVTSF